MPKDYSNFPQKYINKHTKFVEWTPPKRPNYQSWPQRWKKFPYYDKFRPWEKPFEAMNAPNVCQPVIVVEPFEIFPVFKGDVVEILTGKDKGKIGPASYIVKERNWVFVQGLNTKLAEYRNNKDEIIMVRAEEQPLLFPRDVALTDPTDNHQTTVKWRYDEEGRRVRVSLRTGRILEIPPEAFATVDFKTAGEYIERAKDTKDDVVRQQTYEPVLKTFEMDIAEQMGVKEDRVPRRFFWF